MRRTFHILEDFFYLAIFVVVAAVVTFAVTHDDDAYPLVSAASVVTTAADRGEIEQRLEVAPPPTQTVAHIEVTSRMPSVTAADASPSR